MPRSLRPSLRRLLELPYGISPWAQHRIRSFQRGFYRENYLYCVERAANEAVALGCPEMTVVEFGVGGGSGLVELERICAYLEKRLPITFAIFGFDGGSGLPAPQDYRDAPFKWNAGDYAMDRAALESVLTRAQLVLGDIESTLPSFIQQYNPPPIGAVLFDLDYYSSTATALNILREGSDHLLPRVECYFDDLVLIPSIGVGLAVHEFNAQQGLFRLEQNPRTVYVTNPYVYGWKIYEFHDFSHPDYEKPLYRDQQAPLIY